MPAKALRQPAEADQIAQAMAEYKKLKELQDTVAKSQAAESLKSEAIVKPPKKRAPKRKAEEITQEADVQAAQPAAKPEGVKKERKPRAPSSWNLFVKENQSKVAHLPVK